MKFKEILQKVKEIKAPDFTPDQSELNTKSKNMETLIIQLKKVDSKTRKSIRLLQIIYIAMILFMSYYIFISDSFKIGLGVGFIILAFFLVIFVQELRYNAYSYTYTNNPVIKYLKDAKKRMQVFTKRTWYVIPIWIFIDIGVSLILASMLQNTQFVLPAIVLFQAILIIVIVIDFYSAYLIWKREHKPVLTEIEKMLNEIENPE